ncbi:MAG: pyruvate formate lyase-activating protein [Lachnospiraceae bacterium]|nr:pyruvate formate lyase-activating protein [Lachnospiraceae bacterium]
MQGWVHSVESFGTVDGPGVRMVIFLQGCPMRCAYCHNPDTWQEKRGTLTDAEELIERFLRNRSYYKNGGITVSGGEPLCQVEFVTNLFRKAKKEGISTCLDTSGVMFSEVLLKEYEELSAVTDLVLLDVKHTDNEEHRKLTGYSNDATFAFLEYLEEKKIPVWIRRVAVPGYTDEEDELLRLGEYIGGFGCVRAVEVLPYHVMGLSKYKELGIPYRLEGVPQMEAEDAKRCRQIILQGVRNRRNRTDTTA